MSIITIQDHGGFKRTAHAACRIANFTPLLARRFAPRA